MITMSTSIENVQFPALDAGCTYNVALNFDGVDWFTCHLGLS